METVKRRKIMRNLIACVICVSILISGAAAAEDMSSAVDPMYLGVGARPLGMGKSFVAIAENAEALLINPAGLGRLEGGRITSMYATLMNDANYMVLAGGMPLNDAVGIGAGFVSVSVSDIGLYDTGGNSLGSASYMNGVAFLSAGVNLENDGAIAELLPNKGRDILIGANLKMFTHQASGHDSVANANGSGTDLDVGILYTPDGWLTLGLNQQNMLSSSMGSKIKFAGGTEEDIPSTTKIGAKIAVLGPAGQALNESHNTLNVGIDADITLWGTAAHIGTEYNPEKWLAIRAGIDQDSSPAGTATNPTLGIGLKYSDFAFDYAYHPYGDIADNTTHFFSISYLGPEIEREEKPEPIAMKEPEPLSDIFLSVYQPENESIVYNRRLKVKARVEGVGSAGSVKIDGKEAKKFRDEYYDTVTLRNPGKNLVTVSASNSEETVVQKLKLLRLLSFSDVTRGFWAQEEIENCATIGLVQGFPDRTFKPNKALTRAELATLIVRARKIPLPDVTGKVFKDMPKTHWAAPYILAAKKEGLVKGYPDGTFRPNRMITRAEGVTVFARSDGLEEDVDMWEPPFMDLSPRHWAARMVSSAYNADLLEYLDGKDFKANSKLARAEAVVILSRTSMARHRISTLRDFSVGFDPMDEEPMAQVQ